MLNTLVTSPSVPLNRLSSSSWILDPPTCGFPTTPANLQERPSSSFLLTLLEVLVPLRESLTAANLPPTSRTDRDGVSNTVLEVLLVSSEKILLDSGMQELTNLLFPRPLSDKLPALLPSSLTIPSMVSSVLPSLLLLSTMSSLL